MSRPSIAIESVTGVDVELEIAGPGARSFAFIIDWHLRLLIAFAWSIAAVMIIGVMVSGGGVGAEKSKSMIGMLIGLPAAGIYFLYHPILEIVMRGRTPGKRMAGLRILTRGGEVPSVGAILIRNIFRLIDSLPAFYVVGLIACIFSQQRVRVGDMAAGTVLVTTREASETAFARLNNTVAKTGLPLATAELIQELLERWWDLDEPRRIDYAQQLLAKAEPAGAAPAATRRPQPQELRMRLRRLLEGAPAA